MRKLLGILLLGVATTNPSQIKFNQNQTGSVSRSLASKLSDTVSVKDFGAVGDGIADDSTAVANAISAAGPTQYIDFGCPGTYKTTAYGTLPCGDYYPPIAAAGAIPRLLPQKVLELTSVKDFGAKGDGTTDDTASVVAAYNASGSSNTTIYFPPGTYKFNLVIARSGVHLMGAARCRIAAPGGGTMFIPADLAKPILQIGDGTTYVETATIEHFCMNGDGTFTVAGTSTSDGIAIVGAYKTEIRDFEIGQLGGKCLSLTSSATRASAYNSIADGTFLNCSRYATYVDYGANFTTATFFENINWSPSNIGSGDYDLYLNGTIVWIANSWFQVGNGHAHVYLAKDAGGHVPGMELATTGIDSGGNPTWVAMDINLSGGAHTYLGNYVTGRSYFIDGKIRWDDGTNYDGGSANLVTPSLRFPNAKVQSQLYFDIATSAGVGVQNDANTPSLSLRGKERSAGTSPYLHASGGFFQIDGTSTAGLQFGLNGVMWRNATSGGLRYRPDFPWPGNDIDGVPVSPVRKAITYSSNMAVDATFGTFIITATNGTAFTINSPSNSATNEEIDFQIINTSGGALGVATWGATYKMVAWVQPANGFSRWIRFRYDGTNWIEMYRSAADIPN